MAKQACELDNAQKYQEALNAYEGSLKYFMAAIKCKQSSEYHHTMITIWL